MILKSERVGIQKKFYDLVKGVVNDKNLCLYDLDYFPGNGELKVFIYSSETKTAQIEDCVSIDRALTPFIDSLEWMPEKLTLEVSSPGVYRNLKTLEHFDMAIGELIAINLNSAGRKEFDFKNKNFIGELFSFDQKGIEVDCDGARLKIPYEYLKSANIEAEM